MKKAFHIAIEGTIGVGKTSLAKLLSKELNAKLVLEEFEENPFLSGFYKDPKKYAFQTQLFFLLSRFRQQEEFRQVDIFSRGIISDYVIIKDRIFAELNLRNSNDELDLYDKVHTSLLKNNIIYPDLIIFLQSDTPRLMNNIKSRGRNYEKNMDWNYIDALNQIYNSFFFKYDESPVLVVNTNDIDFVNDKDDFQEILNVLKGGPIVGTKYFNPTKSTNI
tara:strand:+ start:1104 stop:1763 length:660 start_codon:yes stop_codon:yes gene_type:complete